MEFEFGNHDSESLFIDPGNFYPSNKCPISYHNFPMDYFSPLNLVRPSRGFKTSVLNIVELKCTNQFDILSLPAKSLGLKSTGIPYSYFYVQKSDHDRLCSLCYITNKSSREYQQYRTKKLENIKAAQVLNPIPVKVDLIFAQGCSYDNVDSKFMLSGITAVKPSSTSYYYEATLRLTNKIKRPFCDFYIREYRTNLDRDIFAVRLQQFTESNIHQVYFYDYNEKFKVTKFNKNLIIFTDTHLKISIINPKTKKILKRIRAHLPEEIAI